MKTKLLAAALAVSVLQLPAFAVGQEQDAALKTNDKTDVDGAKKPNLAIRKTEISNFDFWSLQCDQYVDAKMGKKCAARLPVFKQNSQELLAVLVINQDDAKKWQLKVVIPTSISVPDGGTIAFDGSSADPQNFPIETCEPAACASNVPLDDTLLETLRGSSKVSLGWTAIDRSPIKFDFEIKGIQQTLKAIFG